MELFTYWRSSAAYRLRIALNLKNLSWEEHFVHLVKDGGQQNLPNYAAINSQRLVPSLKTDDENILTQSLAILEYLEETYPKPAILPTAPIERARIRAFAQAIACEIHPVNNLRVLKYLVTNLKVDETQKMAWYHHWIHEGFKALESQLQESTNDFKCCFGDTPTLADICLVPQMYNARRFELDLSPYPRLVEIDKYLTSLPAFQNAAPEAQKDADI